MTRHFCDEIVELPQPRGSLHDRHHLFWPASDLRQLGLANFRALACASTQRFDSMVHSLVHQRHAGVQYASREIERHELLRRARGCVIRHEDRRCSCFKSKRLRSIDALTLERVQPHTGDRPPCVIIRVDADVHELMDNSYLTVAPLAASVYEQLDVRHADGLCGCRPPALVLPDFYLQPAWTASVYAA